ncbi:MAG: RodZ domain-containing protein [Vicinamibacteria bacterium]
MASLSERLRRERELRGISLKQISEETRIGVRFLEALEADKIDIIPGEFYRRSYLRAYARYLGLDEDRALNAYDFSRKDNGPSEEPGPRLRDPAAPPTPLPNWVKWAVAALAIGASTILLLMATPASRQDDAPAPSPSPAEGAREDTASLLPPEELSPTPFPPEPATLDGALRLELSVEESCWLEIEADGELVVSGLKDQGFRQEVVARRELRLWLGNAGGVKLLVNDRPVRTLGRSGQVRRDLTITPDNYRDFVSSEDRS